jgi:hypothetical protein
MTVTAENIRQNMIILPEPEKGVNNLPLHFREYKKITTPPPLP